MMTAPDVLGVLSLLDGAGLTAWVDGGWGVDALLGETTRDHGDLDVAVLLPQLEEVRSVLAEAGYGTVLRDWLPASLALADQAGREIDLHTLRPTTDGGGDQSLPDGGSFHYPPPVRGTIAGRPVRCMDAGTQVRAHLGYQPTAKDRVDMGRLRERLGVALPAPNSSSRV
jgi:lincosamide nucleotidyltransferase A/C/D/E